MSDSLAWLNGQFTPLSQISLPLNDVGFLLGVTVTDRCRTFGHRLFRLPDHVDRFVRNCALAKVPLRATAPELVEIAEQLTTQNVSLLSREEELSLIMFATPGTTPAYGRMLGEKIAEHPTLCLHVIPLDLRRYESFFQEGASLVIPSVRQLASSCVSPQIKNRSRLHWWLAEQEAFEKSPGSLALLLNEEGHLTETAIANFLLVCEGVALSPRRQDVLDGISLRVVMELCEQLGIGFVERDLTFSDCEEADEAMICGTSFCLAPVGRIETKRFPVPGPVTERLMRCWTEQVAIR